MIRATLLLAIGSTALGQAPGAADVNRDGCVDLADFAMVMREWTGGGCREPSVFMEMVEVPGGGSGPEYTFEIGRYEVTVEQFAAFLNDAERDGGATGRGAYIEFQMDGTVLSAAGETLAVTYPREPYSWILRLPEREVGERFVPLIGFERHPFAFMTWVGAAKFCNWLTLDQGIPEEDRCYGEGPRWGDFVPRVVTPAVYDRRDLNASEIEKLVGGCRGFRMPLGGRVCAPGSEYVSCDESLEFDEWMKAAAYDPTGPTTPRLFAWAYEQQGVWIPAKHWAYGYGRDSVERLDANLAFDSAYFHLGRTLPVGFYNGVNLLPDGRATNANGNFFGLYDATGNADEWSQDRDYRGAHTTRGGSFWTVLEWQLPLVTIDQTTYDDSYAGLRVVRVP